MNPDRGTFDFTFPDGIVHEFRMRPRELRELESLLEQREKKPVPYKAFFARQQSWSSEDVAMLMLAGFAHADPGLTIRSFDEWPYAKVLEFESVFEDFMERCLPERLKKKRDEMVEGMLERFLEQKKIREPIGQTS